MQVDEETRQIAIKTIGLYLNKTLTEKVEKSINEFSLDYANINETPFLLNQIYETKVDDIVKILSDKENDFLITSLKNGLIDPTKIGFMQPEKLNPEKYDKIIKRKEIEEYKKNNQTTSNVFQCKKCKNKKCQVTQRQTRAADEPATTFVTCMECGYEFSFN